VHERFLKRFRDKIRARAYVMTVHAEEEMTEDDFTVFDIERGILTGRILERQRDSTNNESKYRIRGKTITGDPIEILAKLSPTGKLVIITVYAP
jgi:Domain of unknown function (DUF4258)